MKKVYRILHYDLIGANLYSYELLGKFEDEDVNVKNGKIISITPNGDTRVGAIIEQNYVRKLSLETKGIHIRDNKFLPYFANVTECLPSCMKDTEPRVYKNCQLMTEKHGTYLQFYHAKTDKILRIALNSNYYEQIK